MHLRTMTCAVCVITVQYQCIPCEDGLKEASMGSKNLYQSRNQLEMRRKNTWNNNKMRKKRNKEKIILIEIIFGFCTKSCGKLYSSQLFGSQNG